MSLQEQEKRREVSSFRVSGVFNNQSIKKQWIQFLSFFLSFCVISLPIFSYDIKYLLNFELMS